MARCTTFLLMLLMGIWQMSASGNENTPLSPDNAQAGSAHGYTWAPFNGGVKLQCESLVAVHLLRDDEVDTTRHGFPDVQAKIIPPRVHVGDILEVWSQGSLSNVTVTSHLLVSSKFGNRYIWGALPAFNSNLDLVAGSPIFKDGKLVSVITKKTSEGKYAVSGISDVSGHFASTNVRARTMTGAQSVYGGFIGGYGAIKTEALRTKTSADGPEHYEIVVGVNTLRVIGWKGDNVETFHTRIGTVPDLTCGSC